MNSTKHRSNNNQATMARIAAVFIFSILVATSSRADMYPTPRHCRGRAGASDDHLGHPGGHQQHRVLVRHAGWSTVEATTNTAAGPWIPVGRTAASDFPWCVTVPNPDPTNSYQFRLNQTNGYAGSGACGGCHGDKYNEWWGTLHASAFIAITNELTQTNELVFRTVGYGQPTGFTSSSNTAYLKNVGCENCHGPAAWHKYSDHSLIRPAVTLSSAVCGGCHNQPDGPTYSEWTNSLHAVVTPDVAGGSSGITNTSMARAGR